MDGKQMKPKLHKSALAERRRQARNRKADADRPAAGLPPHLGAIILEFAGDLLCPDEFLSYIDLVSYEVEGRIIKAIVSFKGRRHGLVVDETKYNPDCTTGLSMRQGYLIPPNRPKEITMVGLQDCGDWRGRGQPHKWEAAA